MPSDFTEIDARLRAMFAAQDATSSREAKLKCDLVLRPPPLLSEYPLLISDEWEPFPGRSQDGKGDLVFTDGRGRYAVVEVKWMGALYAGPSQRKRRNKKRGIVRKQAKIYAVHVLSSRADAAEVRMLTFTNDPQGGGLADLGVLTPTSLVSEQ